MGLYVPCCPPKSHEMGVEGSELVGGKGQPPWKPYLEAAWEGGEGAREGEQGEQGEQAPGRGN